MATPTQIRQAVDDQLATLWAAIQSKESTYATNHNGRYWQGLRTHTLIPADGLTALPTIGATCPSDQLGQPWPNGILTMPLEMALQLDSYDGPLGLGYVASVRVTINGNIWMRAAQVGPEPWRAYAWQQAGPPLL